MPISGAVQNNTLDSAFGYKLIQQLQFTWRSSQTIPGLTLFYSIFSCSHIRSVPGICSDKPLFEQLKVEPNRLSDPKPLTPGNLIRAIIYNHVVSEKLQTERGRMYSKSDEFRRAHCGK